MRRAIREHLRDFVAIGVLIVLAIVTTGRDPRAAAGDLPVLGPGPRAPTTSSSRPSSPPPRRSPRGRARRSTSPGSRSAKRRGRRARERQRGRDMEIDNKYAPLIHPDATLLLRPRTGLQDMTIEVDPGTERRRSTEGSTIPLAQTQPNVQPDQILASLDARHPLLPPAAAAGGRRRAWAAAAAQARGGPEALRAHGPRPGQDRRRARGAAPEHRRVDPRTSAASARSSATATPSSPDSSAPPTTCSARSRDQEASIRADAPGAAGDAAARPDGALAAATGSPLQLGPASRRLIPAAQALGAGAAPDPAAVPRDGRPDPATRSGRSRARSSKPLQHLKQAAKPLAQTSTGLDQRLRRPQPAASTRSPTTRPVDEEGYLFWLAWLNHDTNALFFTQDAGGPLRHGLVLLDCVNGAVAAAPLGRRHQTCCSTLQQQQQIPRRRAPVREPPRPGPVADGDPPAHSHTHPGRDRLRALVLRAGALPVDRLRRADCR